MNGKCRVTGSTSDEFFDSSTNLVQRAIRSKQAAGANQFLVVVGWVLRTRSFHSFTFLSRIDSMRETLLRSVGDASSYSYLRFVVLDGGSSCFRCWNRRPRRAPASGRKGCTKYRGRVLVDDFNIAQRQPNDGRSRGEEEEETRGWEQKGSIAR